MKVEQATIDDITEWLKLAAEVEYLFGPMVGDHNFINGLEKNIGRSSAFCVRRNDGPPGGPLLGGLLWSSKRPVYKIGWLSVCSEARKQGVATELLNYMFGLVETPAEIEVTTFGDDVVDGRPARILYTSFGFVPLDERLPNGPEGGSRQKFRRLVTS